MSKDCWHLVEAIWNAIWVISLYMVDRLSMEKHNGTSWMDFPQVFACHIGSVIFTDIIWTVLETLEFSIQICQLYAYPSFWARISLEWSTLLKGTTMVDMLVMIWNQQPSVLSQFSSHFSSPYPGLEPATFRILVHLSNLWATCPRPRCVWRVSGVRAVEWPQGRPGTWPGTTSRTSVPTAAPSTAKVGPQWVTQRHITSQPRQGIHKLQEQAKKRGMGAVA